MEKITKLETIPVLVNFSENFTTQAKGQKITDNGRYTLINV